MNSRDPMTPTRLSDSAVKDRHVYESGLEGKCRVCRKRWGNPVHRQSKDALHSPLPLALTEDRARSILLMGMHHTDEFYNSSGKVAAALLERLVQRALREDWS